MSAPFCSLFRVRFFVAPTMYRDQIVEIVRTAIPSMNLVVHVDHVVVQIKWPFAYLTGESVSVEDVLLLVLPVIFREEKPAILRHKRIDALEMGRLGSREVFCVPSRHSKSPKHSKLQAKLPQATKLPCADRSK
jgi:hypothetical protein